MYIDLPPNVESKKLFYSKIQSKHIEVGIKGNPPYLNHQLTCPVKTDSSFWTIEDDIMHITLQKRAKGETWPSPIAGLSQLDPHATDLEQKRLMLQRFQQEVFFSFQIWSGQAVKQLSFGIFCVCVVLPFTVVSFSSSSVDTWTGWQGTASFFREAAGPSSGGVGENPGFDFSQAQFTGNCPDPRTFMGGIRSD
ncbi:hypothetical protein ACFE04_027998 [Oxalis oulophora]